MKKITPLATLLLCMTIPVGSSAAPEAPPAAATIPAAVSDEAAIQAELSVVVDKVRAKLQAGESTEAALTAEVKEMDALYAKYVGKKSEAAAKIGMMRAQLYLEVFKQHEKGVALLKELKVAFPETKQAAGIDKMIQELEAEAVAEALTAVGKPFAPFSEKDLTGAPLELASYKGKIVLVDFWATWCGPCVNELPNVLAAYEKYHAQGFEVVGVSLDGDRAALDAFIGKHKMNWPQFFDGKGWENKLAQAYGIRSIPATFLLDREGNIVAKGLRGKELSEKVGALLSAAK